MLAIRGARVFDPRARQAPRRDLFVKDGRIAAIVDPGTPAAEGTEEVEASGRILMPGLINSHTHSSGNVTRSWMDRWSLELQLSGGPAVRGSQTLDDKYVSALLGACEMISKGCTACYDLFYEFPAPTQDGMEAVARAYADAGLRAVLSPMLADQTFYQAVPGLIDALPDEMRDRFRTARPASWQQVVGTLTATARDWSHDRDQVRFAIAPTIPMHCTDEYLLNAAAFARDLDIGFHTHLAESKVQAVYAQSRYGMSITTHLQKLGILGPNFTAAHCVWIDDDDVARLADSGSVVSHNPGSNMRLGSGIAATRRMLERNLRVGVGTDSRLCSDNLNMFEAMRLAGFASRVQGDAPLRWLRAEEAFEMATVGSAHALGMGDRIGALEPGYYADIVFLDGDNLNYVPLNDVTNQIVYAEDATAVESVMINGRFVYRDRRFTTVDIAALRIRAQATADRLRDETAEARALSDRLEPMVASFCGGLANCPHHVHAFVPG